MCEDDIERTASEFRAEVERDIFELPFVAESLREDLNLTSQHDIRRCTLDVIGRLIKRGVCPGDYVGGAIISFWPGEPCSHLKRIEAEWIDMGKTPTSVAPICWFGLKPVDQG